MKEASKTTRLPGSERGEIVCFPRPTANTLKTLI